MDIATAFEQYVAGRAREYAISLELAQWLDEWIREHKPRRILDIGSGFSSWLFRQYPEIDAWSTEEDPAWLDSTRTFLEGAGCHQYHLMSWDSFNHMDHGQFDLVLLDCGHKIRRTQVFRSAIHELNTGGTMIVDDAHFTGVHHLSEMYARLQGMTFYEIPETLDDFKRFAIGIVKDKEPHQLPVSVLLYVPRGMVNYDESWIWFARIFQQGWALLDVPPMNIAQARDVASASFLEQPEFTHMVMIDQDHKHPPDIVRRLAARVAEDRDRWVVGGLHHRRGKPFDPTAYWLDPKTHQYYTVPPERWGTEIREVDCLGTPASIYAREVFEKFGPTWFGYDYSRAEEGIYPSDDTMFSQRAKAAGIRLWCDPTICSPHLFMDVIDRAYFKRWVAEHPDEINESGDIVINRDR